MAGRSQYKYKRIKARRRQEKAEYKTLVTTLAILLVAALIIFFLGIPFLAKMGGFLSKVFQGNSVGPITNQDTIAPRPPYIDNLPEGTKNKVIEVKGLAEPGSTVTLLLNNERAKEALADGEGSFTFEYVPLKEGKNTITATAKDSAGNESDPAQQVTITLKTSAPKLEITTPSDNQSFRDIDNPIKVGGITEPNTKVYVNDTLAIVDSAGNFEKYLVLKDEGTVVIKLRAVDIAGNETNKEVSVVFKKK